MPLTPALNFLSQVFECARMCSLPLPPPVPVHVASSDGHPVSTPHSTHSNMDEKESSESLPHYLALDNLAISSHQSSDHPIQKFTFI